MRIQRATKGNSKFQIRVYFLIECLLPFRHTESSKLLHRGASDTERAQGTHSALSFCGHPGFRPSSLLLVPPPAPPTSSVLILVISHCKDWDGNSEIPQRRKYPKAKGLSSQQSLLNRPGIWIKTKQYSWGRCCDAMD